MTASQQAKAAGFKSLQQVAELTGWTTETLRNFHKQNPRRFRIILAGCEAELKGLDE